MERLIGGKQTLLDEDFTGPVNRCRIESKKFLLSEYDFQKITALENGGLKSKRPSVSLNDGVALKFTCRLALKAASQFYIEKLDKLIVKDIALTRHYEETVGNAKRKYDLKLAEVLAKCNSIDTFYPMYLNALKDYFRERFIVMDLTLCDFKVLSPDGMYDEQVNDFHIKVNLSESNQLSVESFHLDIKYYYLDEVMGKDRVFVTFRKNASKVFLNLKESIDMQYAHAIKLKEFEKYIEKISGSDLMQNERSLRAFYESYVRSLEQQRREIIIDRRALEREYENILADVDKFHERLERNNKLISNLQREDLFCYLVTKNLRLFESERDVKLSKVGYGGYKGKNYCVLSFIYLNIFNNVNIKVNDQYKIARYLFDHLVRKGIREFSEALKADGVDGIAFNIAATDRSFVHKEKDPNVSMYTFYLPGKEILRYINDDITGKELADISYILVDGERIHLR